MGRKKKIREEVITDNKSKEIDDPLLPKKSLFRVDEVAAYFGVSRSVVYLWIDHGIISAEKIGGTIIVSRDAIISCRLRNRLDPLA